MPVAGNYLNFTRCESPVICDSPDRVTIVLAKREPGVAFRRLPVLL